MINIDTEVDQNEAQAQVSVLNFHTGFDALTSLESYPSYKLFVP